MKTRARPITVVVEKIKQEKCGIVALYRTNRKETITFTQAISALNAIQHRAQDGFGFALRTPRGETKRFTKKGLIQDGINQSLLKKYSLSALWILGQCRYGTEGKDTDYNLQPCVQMVTAQNATKSNKCPIFVIHNGNFVAIQEMRGKLKRPAPQGASDTYIFTRLLAQNCRSSGADKAVLKTLNMINGAFALVIAIGNTIYLARDQFGLRPLVLGKLNNGFVAASETCALDKIGAKTIREIRGGEIVKINKKGVTILQKATRGESAICNFEDAYFSFPGSRFSLLKSGDASRPHQWSSYLSFRIRLGEALAQEHPLPHADCIVDIPDSGRPIAVGYSRKSGTPYTPLLLRDHYDANSKVRTFMNDRDVKMIGHYVLKKLSLVIDPYLIKNKTIILADDSIVRGSVSRVITQALWKAGAKAVHWVVGFPPVLHPCHLGVNMQNHKELIAYLHNGDCTKIARAIKATSVHYISIERFLEERTAYNKIVKPTDLNDIALVNGACMGCVTGRYPIDKNGTLYNNTKK